MTPPNGPSSIERLALRYFGQRTGPLSGLTRPHGGRSLSLSHSRQRILSSLIAVQPPWWRRFGSVERPRQSSAMNFGHRANWQP